MDDGYNRWLSVFHVRILFTHILYKKLHKEKNPHTNILFTYRLHSSLLWYHSSYRWYRWYSLLWLLWLLWIWWWWLLLLLGLSCYHLIPFLMIYMHRILHQIHDSVCRFDSRVQSCHLVRFPMLIISDRAHHSSSQA